MYMSENVKIALMLTTLAGLSTGIGSAIAYFIKKPKTVYLTFSLGLSAGVMIYLSFMELLPEAINSSGEILGTIAFSVGLFFIYLIDRFIPEAENPHHVYQFYGTIPAHDNNVLMRTGLFTALGISIHNFP